MKGLSWVSALAVCALSAAAIRADVVHLANGNVLRGEVVREDERSIVLKTAHSELTIVAGDILRIDREAPVDRLRGLAEEALEQGAHERAIEYLAAALKEAPEGNNLRALLAQAYEGHTRRLTREGRFTEAEEVARAASASGLALEAVRQELASRRETYEEFLHQAEAAVEVGQY